MDVCRSPTKKHFILFLPENQILYELDLFHKFTSRLQNIVDLNKANSRV
jgi:hypothetical protein